MSPAPQAASADSAATAGAVLDIASAPDACDFGHDGLLLDFGEAALSSSLRPRPTREDDFVEHEGATWQRVRSRALAATFVWPAAADEGGGDGVYVEARVRGGIARAIAVAIDGRPLGSWPLSRGTSTVVATRPSNAVAMTVGAHELELRLVGGARGGDEPLAEIDWVHVGTGDPDPAYAAPTRRDVLVDATAGGRALRGLSLRAPGYVRCSGWVPANATVEMALSTEGGGDAEVEARLVRDRRPPTVLGDAVVPGGGTDWVPWSVPVAGLEGNGALASLELVVKRAPKGTRVLLGGARVVAAGSIAPRPPPTTRGVVLIVLGSISPRSLAPWGGPHAAPQLSAVAAGGSLFLAHRAASSLANAAFASMLTGLPPRAHGVDSPVARLADGVTTIEDACREGKVATAMFTANPTTGPAFGFARGWDTFSTADPLDDTTGARVFDEAAEFIDHHRTDRFLVVVHARGGHPPWEASPDELKAMPPDGYFGMLEPHRAAEALAKARAHPARFKEDDRVRAWALYDHAVDEQDAMIGRVTAALRNAGRDGDTAVIVTGDVSANEIGPVPFCEPETLDEPLLAVPLAIHWPGDSDLVGRTVALGSESVDIARTVLDALGLSVPPGFRGVDLAALARGALVPEQRPLLAMRAGRFSVRWGPYVLLGSGDRELRMCDLLLDPSCVADVRGTSPVALDPLRRWAYQTLEPLRQNASAPHAASLDERTISALVRWGHSFERERDEDGRHP